jgi:hypothetical protein
MGLRLVHSTEVACWPWGLEGLSGQAVQWATCRTCQRDVAQPKASARDVPVCLYCALDSGLLPAIETELVVPTTKTGEAP